MKKGISLFLMLLIALFTTNSAYAQNKDANDCITTHRLMSEGNSIIFEASFINGNCDFVEPDGSVSAWVHDSDGFMKADAYGKVDSKTEFFLVSPEITLDKIGNTVSFDECGSYFGNRWKDEAQLVIKEAVPGSEWEVIDRNYLAGDHNTVVNTGDINIPSQYNGKKVNIAFKYVSDGHKNSGLWYVKNLIIKTAPGAKADAELTFSEDKIEYILDSDELFTAPTLNNPNNLEVKYSSSDADVATVDALSGAVSIKALGTTVITAESAETEVFQAGKASYTINVISSEDAQYAESALRSPIVAIEFTGQRCRYCPNQARDLAEKQIKYGNDNFIIAALHHLESFSKLPEGQVSLYNEEAMQYAESLEIHDGLPQLAYNSLGPGRTDHTIDEMFQEDDLLECTGNVTYNNNNEYNINIKTRLRRNQKTSLEGKQTDIILWTLENGIVAFQDDNGNYTYPEHNHIFRGSINTTWGEPYEVGSEYTNTLKAPVSVSEIKNTDVVVFFIDHDSRMILDAALFKASADDTGIDNINCDEPDSNIYNLMGMKVSETVKGQIYVKNGKKFIVR